MDQESLIVLFIDDYQAYRIGTLQQPEKPLSRHAHLLKPTDLHIDYDQHLEFFTL
jgi:hypothetical protein